MASIYEPKQILASDETTGTVFNPFGRFQIVLIGIPASGNHTWHLEIKPTTLPDSGAWTIMTSQSFSSADGRQSGSFDGSPGFMYRVRNTHASPATGVTAYWQHVGTQTYA